MAAGDDHPAGGANDNAPQAGPGACPVCSKPGVMQYRPFCSRRCADVDLARWLGARYAIAAAPDADDEGGEYAAPERSVERSGKPPDEQ